MTQVADDLRAAKALLVRDGICRRRIVDHLGRRCSYGAIVEACAGDDGVRREIAAVAALYEKTRAPIATWNDRSTDDEILAGFDKAIAAAVFSGGGR